MFIFSLRYCKAADKGYFLPAEIKESTEKQAIEKLLKVVPDAVKINVHYIKEE